MRSCCWIPKHLRAEGGGERGARGESRPRWGLPLLSRLSPRRCPLQGAAEPSPAPLLSAKPQKRKAAEMTPGLLQRTATIGSCPVIYSQPLMAASKYQPSAVPLASLRPRQRLQGELQGRANLRLAPGHAAGPQPAGLAMQPGYLGVTAPAAPSLMSYSECAVPASLAAAPAVPLAPARGSLPTTSAAEQPPPPPPPQTPPPPTPKAPPPPEKPEKPEKPRKGRKDKVGGCPFALPSPACPLLAPPSPRTVEFPPQGKKGKTKMPSLVKKWQSIQRELDEEENSSSSEEDRETTAQRRIEEWKQQQLLRYGPGRLSQSRQHFVMPCCLAVERRLFASLLKGAGFGVSGWKYERTGCWGASPCTTRALTPLFVPAVAWRRGTPTSRRCQRTGERG